jgi:hypothetical protein
MTAAKYAPPATYKAALAWAVAWFKAQLDLMEPTNRKTMLGKDMKAVVTQLRSLERALTKLDAVAKMSDTLLANALRLAGTDALKVAYGEFGNHPVHHAEQWMAEVADDRTRLGYWEWVHNRIVPEVPR